MKLAFMLFELFCMINKTYWSKENNVASAGDSEEVWDMNNASRQSIIIEQAHLIFCLSFVCVIILAQGVDIFT